MAKDFLLAISIMMVLEGLTYASSPEMMKEIMKKLIELDNEKIRSIGLIVTAIGVVLYLVFKQIYS